MSLASPQQAGRPGKVAAFADTWEPDSQPRGVEPGRIGPAVCRALGAPADVLADNAADLCRRYRDSLAQWAGWLPSAPLAQ